MHAAPGAFGTPGLVAALPLILIATFLQIRNRFPLVVNLATAPPIAADGDFPWMVVAVLLAAFFGGVAFLVKRLTAERAAAG